MTEAQRDALLASAKPVPAMFLSGGAPMFGSPQENANSAWQALAKEIGFVWDSVRPVPGKGDRFFTAESTEESGDA